MLIPLSSSLDNGQHTAANKALIWVSAEFCINVHSIVVEIRDYRRHGVIEKHSRPEKAEFHGVQQCEEESSELKSGINGLSANRRHSLFHQQG